MQEYTKQCKKAENKQLQIGATPLQNKKKSGVRNEQKKGGKENKNTTKRIASPQIIPTCSPDRKRKEIAKAERPSKRGGGTEKSLQKANSAKAHSLSTKMNEGMCKNIAKNKASSGLYIQTQNSKQRVNTQAQTFAQHI